MAKKIPGRDYPPPELQKQMWERYQELKRTYPGKLPQGASQFTYKGNVFTVKPNSKLKKGFQVKSADVDRLAANTRRGTKLTLLDYVNHPRYAGDPELATQMYEYDRQQLKRYGQRSSRANQLDHIDPVKGDVRKGVEHYRNKLLLGADDNALKSNKVPSDSTLEYMGIGRTPEEMVDRAASSPYPRQTPRDKRLMLQGDLDIDFKKGMGLAPSGGGLKFARNATRFALPAVAGGLALSVLNQQSVRAETMDDDSMLAKTRRGLADAGVAGDSMAIAGMGLSATGAGAIVGVPLAAAGEALSMGAGIAEMATDAFVTNAAKAEEAVERGGQFEVNLGGLKFKLPELGISERLGLN